MSNFPPVLRLNDDVYRQVKQWKEDGFKVGLVPTMGALHHGHLSLVEHIKKHCDKVIVSIFVNPTQFGESEDLDAYPRQEAADLAALSPHNVDMVFAPTAQEIYPDGHATTIKLSGISEILEGANRPRHFDGVATVVSKLFLITLCDVAIFGEKDYQQLAVIRRFTKDLNLPVDILGGSLIRESDGLAASSRNVHLTPTERNLASNFSDILQDVVERSLNGESLRACEESAVSDLLSKGFQSVDYVSIVDKDTLSPIDTITQEARVIAVARIGSVRLLDNMAIKP